MGERWGWVDLDEEGEVFEIWSSKHNKSTYRNKLPDWIKTKMAMLNFVDRRVRLPCGSYWDMLFNRGYENPETPLKTYFIHED